MQDAEPINIQDPGPTVTPSTSTQVVTPAEGYNGMANVSVQAVDSTIDANIIPGNIRSGVSILGVTGDYTGPVAPTNGYHLTLINKLTWFHVACVRGDGSIEVYADAMERTWNLDNITAIFVVADNSKANWTSTSQVGGRMPGPDWINSSLSKSHLPIGTYITLKSDNTITIASD